MRMKAKRSPIRSRALRTSRMTYLIAVVGAPRLPSDIAV
jgi:hypothetical protein